MSTEKPPEPKHTCRCFCWCAPDSESELKTADSVLTRPGGFAGFYSAAAPDSEPPPPPPTRPSEDEEEDAAALRAMRVATDPDAPSALGSLFDWMALAARPKEAKVDPSILDGTGGVEGGGPGIHPPPPPTPGRTWRDRSRRTADTFAGGTGEALTGGGRAQATVYAPSIPKARSRPTIVAGEIPWQRPVARIEASAVPSPRPIPPAVLRGPGADLQGESSVVALGSSAPPALHGLFAYAGTLFPPDAVRYERPRTPSLPPVAPPHAGSFVLGGPDAPPGSGIGASRAPVAGHDGYPRWLPIQEAATRTEDSDLDESRPQMPLRLPFGSREGELGPGPPTVSLEVRIRGVAPPQFLPPADAAPPLPMPWPPGTIGKPLAFLPGLDGGSPPPGSEEAPAVQQPPTGPWDLGTVALLPPPVAGLGEGAVAVEPPQAPPDPSAPPPQAQFRPVQEGLDAFKGMMKGSVPTDDWRPPKPSVAGPPGAHGGRGPGLSGSAEHLFSVVGEAEAARRDLDRLLSAPSNSALVLTGSADAQYVPPSLLRQYAEEHEKDIRAAKERLVMAQLNEDAAMSGLGTQALDRAREAMGRQVEAETREWNRFWDKAETRPNYWEWTQGRKAQDRGRAVQATATDIVAKATHLKGKDGSALIGDIKAMAKEAKETAKDAKAAGKKAKRLAKYGPPEAARAAAKEADRLASLAEKTAGAARGLLDAATSQAEGGGKDGGKDKGSPGGAGGPQDQGSGTHGKGGSYSPPRAVATPLDSAWWDIGGEFGKCGDPEALCKPDAIDRLNCGSDQIHCTFLPGKEIPPDSPGTGPGGGTKGKGTTVSPEAAGPIPPDVSGAAPAKASEVPPTVAIAEGAVVAGEAGPEGASSTSSMEQPRPPVDPKPLPEVQAAAEEALQQFFHDLASVTQAAQDLVAASQAILNKVLQGRPLTAGDKRNLKHLGTELAVAIRAQNEIGSLIDDAQGVLVGNALDPMGTRSTSLSALGGLERAGRSAMREAKANSDQVRVQAANDEMYLPVKGFDYSRGDLKEAERLLKVAGLTVDGGATPGDRVTAEGRQREVDAAREEIERLGLKPGKAGTVELAQLLNRRRLNAEMEEADRAASWWSLSLDSAARLGEAAEKLTVEAPLIALQAIASAVQGDLATTSARLGALQGTFDDAQRLKDGFELDLVAGAGERLAQSTLGSVSLQASAEEERAGEDSFVRLARGMATTVGKGAVWATRIYGMGMAGAGLVRAGIGAVKLAAKAAQAARGVVSEALGSIRVLVNRVGAAGVQELRAAARAYPSRAGVSALEEVGEAAGAESRGIFGRLDAAIRRRAAAYRESEGIDLFARSDPSLPPPEPGTYGRLSRSGLGEGRLGITTDQGQAFVRADLEGERLIVAARHEVLGHRTLIPDAAGYVDPVLYGTKGRTFLQGARRWALDRSAILDFLDEARAHEIATGSFQKGLLYGIHAGKFQSGRMLGEAAVGAGAGVGTYYGVKAVVTPGQ